MSAPRVLYSTLSSDAVKDLVLSGYDVGASAQCVFFHRGLNDTYRIVAADRQFALRIYRQRWRNPEQISGEVAALVHLSEKGVSLAAPICRNDGEWLTPVDAPEGRRYAVLFNWVNGVEPRYMDATHAGLHGQLAARLHLAADDCPVAGREPLDLNYLLEGPVTRLRPPLGAYPSLLSRFEALVSRVAERFELVREQLDDWGFVHGDLHGGNAYVDGNRMALYDFDCCGPGWRAYDLATYRWAARIRRVDEQAWKPFIDAYLQVRPAAASTVEHVRLFVVLRHLWLHGYHAWDAMETGVGYQSERYFDGLVSFLEQLESEAK